MAGLASCSAQAGGEATRTESLQAESLQAESLQADSHQSETLNPGNLRAETSQTGAKHSISGLEIIALKVRSQRGNYGFAVELANTPEAQARGLMFRTELGDFEGMLFPSTPPSPRSFWMKNTPLSLDIIFIGIDGRISNIAAKTTPYSLQPVTSEGMTSAVLELRGGRTAELGIAPGDKVEWVQAE